MGRNPKKKPRDTKPYNSPREADENPYAILTDQGRRRTPTGIQESEAWNARREAPREMQSVENNRQGK